MLNAFDQEHYAAQLANYYQSVAEHEAARIKQEVEWLRQTIQQQSVLQNQSQFSMPAQFSMLNTTTMLAGQLGS